MYCPGIPKPKSSGENPFHTLCDTHIGDFDILMPCIKWKNVLSRHPKAQEFRGKSIPYTLKYWGRSLWAKRFCPQRDTNWTSKGWKHLETQPRETNPKTGGSPKRWNTKTKKPETAEAKVTKAEITYLWNNLWKSIRLIFIKHASYSLEMFLPKELT